MAVFPETHSVTVSVKRKDYPEPIPKGVTWAFFRSEGNE